ncbi:LAME_0C09648g1_1 [Lachancea meyersii CBS 8951]|uniref:LAME_0C09648g1_1 n=1 Tax=Lachancea meyersii CBS 8951 TaxID=1266667 RepID=A0A1G4J4E1_9SACH|nr:LAME_0C09648g1_1 [Lachancea meyersii CBS 8951]
MHNDGVNNDGVEDKIRCTFEDDSQVPRKLQMSTLAMKSDIGEEHSIRALHVGDQAPRIPRDIFPSRFQYNLTRHRTSLTVIGLELAVCTFAIMLACKTKDRNKIVLATLSTVGLGGFAVIITALLISDKMRKLTVTRTNTIQFMKEVATIRPGIETQEWDVIAARMNLVFYSGNSSVTPYFFYDGESCYSFFKTAYLLPYLRRKTPNWFVIDTIDELQPLIDQVLKDYEERVNNDWQRILNEGTSVENQAMDV